MVAVRDELLAEATAYESAERRIKNWARERKRITAAHAAFVAQLNAAWRSSSSDSQTQKAADSVQPFKQESRRDRLKKKKLSPIEQQRKREEEERRAARKAQREARRGTGPVSPCRHCGKLCRGGKCSKCKDDPELVTARGKQTSAGEIPEPQPPYMTLSIDAQLIESVIDNRIPQWAADALHRTFRQKESFEYSADAWRILPGAYAQYVKAAVRHVIIELARVEAPRVSSAAKTF